MVVINIEKRHFLILLSGILLLAIAIGAYAYGGSNPSVVGHTAEEIEGLTELIDASVSASIPSEGAVVGGAQVVPIGEYHDLKCTSGFAWGTASCNNGVVTCSDSTLREIGDYGMKLYLCIK